MIAASFPLSVQVEVPTSHWDNELAADIFAPCGTPWLAVFDGVAEPINVVDGGYALMLYAVDGMTAYYAHGEQARASGWVKAGQQIGRVSDSGNAAGTGCHLHFAVGEINNNGGGTISPATWLGHAVASPPMLAGLVMVGLVALILWAVM